MILTIFFILPQINWNSKSMSIRYLSKRLNIDPKFIAFIDDQKNELMQVKYKFPSIKTIDSKKYRQYFYLCPACRLILFQTNHVTEEKYI